MSSQSLLTPLLLGQWGAEHCDRDPAVEHMIHLITGRKQKDTNCNDQDVYFNEKSLGLTSASHASYFKWCIRLRIPSVDWVTDGSGCPTYWFLHIPVAASAGDQVLSKWTYSTFPIQPTIVSATFSQCNATHNCLDNYFWQSYIMPVFSSRPQVSESWHVILFVCLFGPGKKHNVLNSMSFLIDYNCTSETCVTK